jgi:hypothetical protein
MATEFQKETQAIARQNETRVQIARDLRPPSEIARAYGKPVSEILKVKASRTDG